MAEELEELWKKLTFTEEEGVGIVLDSSSTRAAKEVGSSLGLVLDVDVPESRVQWSKCLRVRVRIDVTKRLVRGKKITIEGGESIWVLRKEAEAGRDHGSKKTSLEISNPMLSQVGTAPHAPLSEALHEKGNPKEWVGKIGGREASLGSQDKVQVIDHAEALIGMQWETAQPQEVDELPQGVLAPIKKAEAKMGGPTYVGSNLGSYVMCNVEEKGWVAKTQGPS
nr:hypothetical protein CFP56_45570 [Quercus suber]